MTRGFRSHFIVPIGTITVATTRTATTTIVVVAVLVVATVMVILHAQYARGPINYILISNIFFNLSRRPRRKSAVRSSVTTVSCKTI